MNKPPTWTSRAWYSYATDIAERLDYTGVVGIPQAPPHLFYKSVTTARRVPM